MQFKLRICAVQTQLKWHRQRQRNKWKYSIERMRYKFIGVCAHRSSVIFSSSDLFFLFIELILLVITKQFLKWFKLEKRKSKQKRMIWQFIYSMHKWIKWSTHTHTYSWFQIHRISYSLILLNNILTYFLVCNIKYRNILSNIVSIITLLEGLKIWRVEGGGLGSYLLKQIHSLPIYIFLYCIQILTRIYS